MAAVVGVVVRSALSFVKTELGLLALVVLVVGSFFVAASGKPGVQLSLLIEALVSVVVLVILIAGLLLFYRALTSRS